MHNLTKQFKTFEKEKKTNQINNIDFIYIINLDHRPERFQKCLRQFQRYQIDPQRFSAIYGWELSQENFNDIGIKVTADTQFDRPVHFRPASWQDRPEFITSSSIGKTCVHFTMAGGALGCYLSHLSILADAYKQGYETIWILEDDFTLEGDPHQLSEYIHKLDHLPDALDWDILYTDDDSYYTLDNIIGQLQGENAPYYGECLVRPNLPLSSIQIDRQPIGSDFFKISGRAQTHSMVLRRSGIKKILDFLEPRGIFRPYDMDVAFIPDIKLYNLTCGLIHGRIRKDPSETNIKLKK